MSALFTGQKLQACNCLWPDFARDSSRDSVPFRSLEQVGLREKEKEGKVNGKIGEREEKGAV